MGDLDRQLVRTKPRDVFLANVMDHKQGRLGLIPITDVCKVSLVVSAHEALCPHTCCPCV